MISLRDWLALQTPQFREGWEAYAAGTSSGLNPYRHELHSKRYAYEQWKRGWQEAQASEDGA